MSQIRQLIPALGVGIGLSGIIMFASGAISAPSEQHNLVRAQSKDHAKMKPRLTKHPSGAFVPTTFRVASKEDLS